MKKIILIITGIILLFASFQAEAKSFGVSPNKAGIRPVMDASTILDNDGKWIGSDDKRIYLTFDCGYENGYTEDILDTLSKNNVKAIFFITGHYLDSSTDIVRRMLDEGHIIGNHTTSHKDFTKSSNEEILKDIKSLEDNFYNRFNIPMSKYVRPPRGEYSNESQALLKENGYKSVFWSLAYVDWNKDQYHGNHYSYNKVMKKIHNGAVILMHTVSKDNAVDLDDIIKELKSQGYVFSNVDELFNI